jgi:hypothetical protein
MADHPGAEEIDINVKDERRIFRRVGFNSRL